MIKILEHTGNRGKCCDEKEKRTNNNCKCTYLLKIGLHIKLPVRLVESTREASYQPVLSANM
jgi:hypothetical protein